MRDPMTVAFQIPNPFTRHHNPEARKKRDRFHGAWSNRPPMIVIWHKDPEKDGSDDSCNWFGRYLGDKEANERQAKGMASWAETGYGPWYFDQPDVPQVMLLPTGFEENSPREKYGIPWRIAWRCTRFDTDGIRNHRVAIGASRVIDENDSGCGFHRERDRVSDVRGSCSEGGSHTDVPISDFRILADPSPVVAASSLAYLALADSDSCAATVCCMDPWEEKRE